MLVVGSLMTLSVTNMVHAEPLDKAVWQNELDRMMVEQKTEAVKTLQEENQQLLIGALPSVNRVVVDSIKTECPNAQGDVLVVGCQSVRVAELDIAAK